MIPVTKSFLPPIEDNIKYLEISRIPTSSLATARLSRNWRPNSRSTWAVRHQCFYSNSCTALQIAIKALDLHGEIITTPISYDATTSTIVCEEWQPVFEDFKSYKINQ